MTLLEAALAYAEYGWHVLPLNYPQDGRCSCRREDCGSPAKHPLGLLVRNGVHDAITDPDTIRRWWSRFPKANVGIRTGRISNLIVIDIDADKAGYDTWARIEAQNPEYPLTRESATGGGGTHLLFSWPESDVTVKNSVGKLGVGVDVRAEGDQERGKYRPGLIVAPPSLHIRGEPYSWCEANRKIQPPPPWLLELLTKKDAPPAAARPQRVIAHGHPGRGDHYVLAALEGELRGLEGVTEGQRNSALNSAAYNVGRATHRGNVPDEVLIDALERMGLHLGLTQSEVRATVRSGLESGKANPRGGGG